MPNWKNFEAKRCFFWLRNFRLKYIYKAKTHPVYVESFRYFSTFCNFNEGNFEIYKQFLTNEKSNIQIIVLVHGKLLRNLDFREKLIDRQMSLTNEQISQQFRRKTVWSCRQYNFILFFALKGGIDAPETPD